MQPGAIQFYEKSFAKWKMVFDEFPNLADDVMDDDLVGAMKEYYGNLRKVQADWPLDFPLQFLVDKREQRQMQDGLPTTGKELAERLERKKALEELKKQNENPGNDPPEKSAEPQPAKSSPQKPGSDTKPEKDDESKGAKPKKEAEKAKEADKAGAGKK